jgi:hypothetical protein
VTVSGLPRRLAVPSVVGAVLLAAAVAVSAGTTAVPGVPSAGAAAPATRALVNAAPTPLPARDAAPAPVPAPVPAPTPAPAPTPNAPQPANTVRLADGGTATLVPKEVVNGVLPVPEGVREAAWWGAPLAAPTGATVLAGHVNWRGATGPFASLWQTQLGDVVTVVDKDGRPFTFRVHQLVTVHKNDLPSRAQELFGQEGPHRLVLVTCGGRWVGGSDGYEENRIAIATPA